MSSASDLTAASWQSLNRLLDEALTLPSDERAAWIEGLGAEHEPLKPVLRKLLARAAGIETKQWMATLPPLSAAGEIAGDTAESLVAGELVGPYRLLRELGIGGMGAVWLAERADGAFKRQVALKLPRTSGTRGLAERLARERDILAALEHPHIARLYDAGIDQRGRPYLALEYVEGAPIDRYCAEHRLPLRARLELVLQVARAVAHAHARLVVHRDLKPSNVLVTAAGEVRLLDFGIAKLMEGERAAETQLTRVAGRALTPDYASPEQIRGDPIGTASDVYSLAVVAYELLTGARPYRLKRGSAAEVEEQILAADAPPASQAAADPVLRRQLRGDLDAILNHALRKDPLLRYPTVDAFAQDLERAMRGEPVLARPDSAWYRARKFVARNRLAVGSAAAIAVAVIAGAGAALWQAQIAREQARLAQQQSEAARKESKRAQAVQKFLLDLFTKSSHLQEDPLKAQQTTARELLDLGAAQIGEALKDVPEAQLEVIAVLADMYTQLALRDQATALMEQGVQIARRTFDANDTRLADMLLSLSQRLQQGPRRAEIPALIEEARAIIDRAGERTSFLRGALLYETARYQRDESLPGARASADALVAFFREHHAQRGTLVNGLRLAARARMFAFDYAGGEALATQAVEAARKRGGAAPAWLVGTLADLAESQWAQAKVEAAERSYRESVAMSQQANGPDHPETLTSNIKLAALLLQTGRRDEGEAIAADVLQRLGRSGKRIASGRAADIRGILAAARFELGLPADAEPFVAADVDDLRSSYPNSGAFAFRLRALAEVKIALGRHDEAEQLVQESEAVWRRFAGPDRPAAGDHRIALTRAKLFNARGDAAAALRALEALPLASSAAAGIDLLAVHADIERARAALRLRDHELGRAAARRAVEAVQRHGSGRMPVLEARALTALGRTEAAAGDASAARTALAAAIGLHHASGDPLSLWRADTQSAYARVLATRDPAQSKALLASARRILAAQPAPASYWQAMLDDDTRLARRPTR